jgi:RimJ/RimL family protein N-acetyltransferase
MTNAAWLSGPLTTDRLHLRAFTASDTPFLIDLGGDAETYRYLGGVTPLEQRRQSIEPAFTKPDVFIVTTGTTPIGFTTLRPSTHPTALDVPELGYIFARAHWGHGYAREAVSATLTWAFDHLEAPRVVAFTQQANQRSCHLLESLGMKVVEQFVEWDAPQNMYSLDRPQDPAR